MTRREDQMRGRIHDVEEQLVKAAIMITEARERAEELTKQLENRGLALEGAEEENAVLHARAEAAERALLNRIHECGQLSDETLRLRDALAALLELHDTLIGGRYPEAINARAALEAKQ